MSHWKIMAIPHGRLIVGNLPFICPYWDICATTQLQYRKMQDFIRTVCYTPMHTDCSHFAGLDVWDKDIIKDIRIRMKEKYGKPTRYSLTGPQDGRQFE